jgi:hypothetical protein
VEVIHNRCGLPASIKATLDNGWDIYRVIHLGLWCEQIIDVDGTEEELISLGNRTSE